MPVALKVVEFNPSSTVSSVPGGLELGPPLGVSACTKCERQGKDDEGHWTIKIRKDGTPWCGREACR